MTPESPGKYERGVKKRYTPAELEDSGFNEIGRSESIDLRFKEPDRGTGGLDPAVWNVYRLFTYHYKSKGLKGAECWRQSRKHAVVLASCLEQLPYINRRGEDSRISVLRYLVRLSEKGKISRVCLDADFNITFFGSGGREILVFNAKDLRKKHIIDYSVGKRAVDSGQVSKTILEGGVKKKAGGAGVARAGGATRGRSARSTGSSSPGSSSKDAPSTKKPVPAKRGDRDAPPPRTSGTTVPKGPGTTSGASKSPKSAPKAPRKSPTAAPKQPDPLDALISRLERTHFGPLSAPDISNVRPDRNISALAAMRAAGQHVDAPLIIAPEHRKNVVCSGYVFALLEAEYGKEALEAAGLLKGGAPSAWRIKDKGLRTGAMALAASAWSALKQRRGGSKDKAPYIPSNRTAYVSAVGNFFDQADSGDVPSVITAFYTETRALPSIRASNAALAAMPGHHQSFNSHSLVCLGREPLQTASATGSASLSQFLKKQTEVAPEWHPYLNIRITRASGETIEAKPDGTAIISKTNGATETTKLSKIKLKSGDQVTWQDVLVTDFFKKEERVIGLAYFASQRTSVLIDYLSINLPKKPTSVDVAFTSVPSGLHSTDYFKYYRPVGFLQVKKGQVLSEEVKKITDKWGLSKAKAQEYLDYYLAALADLGIDVNAITPQDILPIFDPNELKILVDKRGGAAKLRKQVVADNIAEFARTHPGEYLIPITAGQSPWQHISPYFSSYFKKNNTLTPHEVGLILGAVDQSSRAIDLSLKKAGPIAKYADFEAGKFIYLTQRRIEQIARWVLEMQAEQFSDKDFVRIVKKGDTPHSVAGLFLDFKAVQMGMRFFRFSELDPRDQNFALGALDACSRDVDLSTVKKGEARHLVSFKEGSRVVFRDADMQFVLAAIKAKRDALAKRPLPKAVWKGKTIAVPASIASSIERVYRGDALTRNLLHFTWANEKGREDPDDWISREDIKAVASAFGLVKSRGEFQIRPTKNDITSCESLFIKFGIPVPKNVEELGDLIEDNELAAVIVAGERYKQELIPRLKEYMALNGEEFHEEDPNLASQLLVCYNRTLMTMHRTAMQSWAINCAMRAGVHADFKVNDIDASIKVPGTRARFERQVVGTFKKVCAKLIRDGKMRFSGDLDAELGKVFGDKNAFFESPLLAELQKWYKSQTGGRLTIVLSAIDKKQGDAVFSYGERFLAHPVAAANWALAFGDPKGLAEARAIMEGPYKLRPFTPGLVPLPSAPIATS